MSHKIIYINPGDMVEIRFIYDKELQKTKKEWEYQPHSHRKCMMLTFPDSDTIHSYDHFNKMAYTTVNGEVKRWLK